ncbi:MAG: DUF4277 domain-containing protein [Desulfobacteraceae bacterium]|nr:DUF4277 domain-containing protein [Desulfobacteraceae bacterium]
MESFRIVIFTFRQLIYTRLANVTYKVEQWAADYMDGLSEYGLNASVYNDDQLAKNLDRVFKADRNSFMAELSANATAVYLLETNQIHNDSISITFMGAYENEDPKAVKGRIKNAPATMEAIVCLSLSL